MLAVYGHKQAFVCLPLALPRLAFGFERHWPPTAKSKLYCKVLENSVLGGSSFGGLPSAPLRATLDKSHGVMSHINQHIKSCI